jgi:hypothetical protein
MYNKIKNMNNETLRMQMLAGLITEGEYQTKINENNPNWIDLDSPKAKILTDIYYIGDNAEGDLRPLRGSAIPANELPEYDLTQIEEEGDGMLYIENGEEGWYNEEEEEFESENENSTVKISKDYIEFI